MRAKERLMVGGSVKGLDHVHVTAPEELRPEVLDWYREIIGLEELGELNEAGEHTVRFSLGPEELHVSVDPHNPPNAAHFGIVVEDFDGMIQRLRERGCHIEQAASLPGRKRCYTRDPAGNRIEISTPEEDPAEIIFEEAVEDNTTGGDDT